MASLGVGHGVMGMIDGMTVGMLAGNVMDGWLGGMCSVGRYIGGGHDVSSGHSIRFTNRRQTVRGWFRRSFFLAVSSLRSARAWFANWHGLAPAARST